MFGILIDYDLYIKKQSLFQKPNKQNGFKTGLILILPEPISQDNLSIETLNSKPFINNIIFQCFVYIQQNYCLLDNNCERYLDVILDTISKYTKNLTVWVYIDIQKQNIIKSFVLKGFHSPFITDKLPNGTIIQPSIALCKENSLENKCDVPVLDKIDYLIYQYKRNKNYCQLYARLSNNAYTFLRSIPLKQKEKEMSGELYAKTIIKQDDKNVYIIDINPASLKTGNGENVDVEPDRYSFHSHPKNTYEKYSVEKGWPSVHDFLACYKLRENCIFHCVATLEGVYIITIDYKKEIKNDIQTYISKNFDIDKKLKMSPEQYVEMINNRNDIFTLYFITDTNKDMIFEVFFPKIGLSCIASQKIIQNYRKLQQN